MENGGWTRTLLKVWEGFLVALGKRLRLFDLGFTIGACALAVLLLQGFMKHAATLYRTGNTP
jgi:hypothetical protein